MSHEQAQAAYQQGQFIIQKVVDLIDYVAGLEHKLNVCMEINKLNVEAASKAATVIEELTHRLLILEAENDEIWRHKT